MKKFLLIVLIMMISGCGNPIAVTQNSQVDCTSGTLDIGLVLILAAM
jgi:hypothetical protein